MKKIILLMFLLFLLPVLSACTKSDQQAVKNAEEILNVDSDGNTKFNESNLKTAINSVASSPLQKIEEDDLFFMVEEEKLAQDVYSFLNKKWSQQVFSNIGQSESTHVSAVRALLGKYNVSVPVSLSDGGIFVNKDLQKLYDDLTKQGSNSLIDALKVGAAVEEIDILDLEKRIAQTDKEDIKLVYDNLMRGSRNHLRSFVRNMKNNGHNYQAQYLTAEAYIQIVNSDNENGSGAQRGRRGQVN